MSNYHLPKNQTNRDKTLSAHFLESVRGAFYTLLIAPIIIAICVETTSQQVSTPGPTETSTQQPISNYRFNQFVLKQH